MPLLSNGLYKDKNFILDCKKKINYLSETPEIISSSRDSESFYIQIAEGKFKKLTEENSENTTKNSENNQ